MTIILIFGIFAGLGSWLVGCPVCRLLLRLGLLDKPNGRSSHVVPTVRGGGLESLINDSLTTEVKVRLPWIFSHLESNSLSKARPSIHFHTKPQRRKGRPPASDSSIK
jgi:hypothetical protein